MVGNGFCKLRYLHVDVLLSFGLIVGSLESDKMVKALCSVIALVVFVVTLFLLQRFPDTIFQSFVSVLSFNPPHRH